MKFNLIDIVFGLILIPIGIIAMTITIFFIFVDFVTSMSESFVWTVYKNRKKE